MRRSIRHWAQVLRLCAAAALTGKAGQAAQTVAKVGDSLARVVFLGVADRSVGALRRAGGELGRQADRARWPLPTRSPGWRPIR